MTVSAESATEPTIEALPEPAPQPPAPEPPRRTPPRVPTLAWRHHERPERPWTGVARSLRARIIISYVVLLFLAAVISTFAIREILEVRLDDSVSDALEQEVLELNELLTDGRDPSTGQPFATAQALFEIYLDRNVPSGEEGLLTFIDGEEFDHNLERYPIKQLPAEMMSYWEDISRSAPGDGGSFEGTFDTSEGKAYFKADPIRLPPGGAFVVSILPAGEREEIEELQQYGVIATVALLLLASGFAWWIAGRVLAPVRELTETAHTISRAELTRRIEVRGGGEAADMARSFNGMLDRLESVFRSQREFAQDASHELRDPLTICRGHLELLGDDPEERRETVALVLDELDRMSRLVDDLQLLADSEQPDFLQSEAFDVAAYTDDLVAKARALASRKWVLDSRAEGTVVADRHRLTEAVMNLAHNAVQHTLEHEEIGIGTMLTDEHLLLWVRDEGAGVALSDQPRIFDRFTRGRGAHRRYRGGGLGLAIVKAIGEAHGGRVALESDLGSGSTFTIVIPRPDAPGEADGQNSDS
jgi:two-component system, OmpR family, sensor kinase